MNLASLALNTVASMVIALIAILFLSWLARHAILSALDLIDVIRSIRDPAETDLGVQDDDHLV